MDNKDSFCKYIRLHEKAMYSLAFSIVRNEADTCEIISESIFRAYKNIDTLKDENAFKPWILRIVHNTAVETVRKNSKIIPVETTPEFSDDTEDDIATRLTVHEAVERLRQPYRTVVVLYYYENLSVSKIAQITGTNIGAVRKQLSRARKMLRENLKEDFDA